MLSPRLRISPKAMRTSWPERAKLVQNQCRGRKSPEEEGVGGPGPSGYLAFCLQAWTQVYCDLAAESIKAATFDLSLVKSSSWRYIMWPAS